MKKAIKTLLPLAEALERLLHPYAEIVLHDVKLDRIEAIYHPFSKRRVGDSSLLTPEDFPKDGDAIGPYEKTNIDGRKLKSVSSVIRDENHKIIGLFCINVDISAFEKFSELLVQFISPMKMEKQAAALFKDDWREKINRYIHAYLNERHLLLAALTREEKNYLIKHLHENGAFSGKNAASYIAEVLNVSRATVYNYLPKKIKARRS